MCRAQGTIFACGDLIMAGNASIVARNLYSDAGGSVAAVTNLTMRDNARIEATGSWGGDGGIVESALATLSDNSVLSCKDSYADNCGGACPPA